MNNIKKNDKLNLKFHKILGKIINTTLTMSNFINDQFPLTA
jgi:hypothetical protein